MPKPITHVLLITDMSGSMSHLADDVRGGFNTYIDGLKGTEGKYRITAAVFDTEFIPLCVGAKLAEVPALTVDNYVPRGSTALLDAVGKTITEFDARVKDLGEDDKVAVVIQTDGEENASAEFSYANISELIGKREATGKWSFTYIGAGNDNWNQAARMGVRHDSYVNTGATRGATMSTYSGLSKGTASYAATGAPTAMAAAVADEPGATDQN